MNTKVNHIVAQVEKDIKAKVYAQGQQILSLTEVQQKYQVSRDTANRAYRDLLKRGVIESKKGKGYYVLDAKDSFQVNVFLLLDVLSDYKNTLVSAIDQALGDRAQHKVFFHHFNEPLFQDLITQNLGKFTHYVVSPFPFSKTVEESLKLIPSKELILLDRRDGNFQQYSFVGQEYELDIIECLAALSEQLHKYQRFIFIFPEQGYHPLPLKRGFKRFFEARGLPHKIVSGFDAKDMEVGDAYLVIEDNDLAEVIEHSRARQWEAGKEIGLLAYNDTRLKAAIGISTLSTDFQEMGHKLSELIFNQTDTSYIRNRIHLFKRESF